jgi:hypothetical protein
MIKDFVLVKKQLQELSSVINSFKSEAVQLRVVELLFQRMGIETAGEPAASSQEKGKGKGSTRRKTATKAVKEKKAAKKRSIGGRPGPLAMIKQLIGQNFFKEPKTIKDIVDYCEAHLGYKYKPGEISTSLTRSVRDGALKRKKNEENQYEYRQ